MDRKTLALREMFQGSPWAVRAVELVHCTPELIVLWYPAGSGFAVPQGYFDNNDLFQKNRWQIAQQGWQLKQGHWQKNNVLIVKVPERYYSVQLFQDAASGEFLGYYINFELPYTASDLGYDTLDLDLDLMVYPDGKIQWKDVEEYDNAVANGDIGADWSEQVELAKADVMARLKDQSDLSEGWLQALTAQNTAPISMTSVLPELCEEGTS